MGNFLIQFAQGLLLKRFVMFTNRMAFLVKRIQSKTAAL